MSDSQPTSMSAGSGAQARSIMPPHLVLRDFIDDQAAEAILEYALAREAAFVSTGVGRANEAGIDQRVRVSVATRDLGPFKSVIRSRVLGFVPDLVERLGMTPLESPKVELQLVAHNDGAFYKRHIDTQTTSDQHSIRVPERRLLFLRQAERLQRRRIAPIRDRAQGCRIRRHRAGAQQPACLSVLGSARGASGQLPIEAIRRLTLRHQLLGLPRKGLAKHVTVRDARMARQIRAHGSTFVQVMHCRMPYLIRKGRSPSHRAKGVVRCPRALFARVLLEIGRRGQTSRDSRDHGCRGRPSACA